MKKLVAETHLVVHADVYSVSYEKSHDLKDSLLFMFVVIPGVFFELIRVIVRYTRGFPSGRVENVQQQQRLLI